MFSVLHGSTRVCLCVRTCSRPALGAELSTSFHSAETDPLGGISEKVKVLKENNVCLKAALHTAQSLIRNVFPSVSLWPYFPPGISCLSHVLSVLPGECLFLGKFTSLLGSGPPDTPPDLHTCPWLFQPFPALPLAHLYVSQTKISPSPKSRSS